MKCTRIAGMLVAMAFLTLASCKEEGPVPADTITLSEESLTIVRGESAEITVTVQPEEASAEDLTAVSSDPETAGVEAAGELTWRISALSEGDAVITFSAGNASAECKVTVTSPVEGITVSPESAVLMKGGTLQAEAAVAPEGAAVPVWASEDEAVATVDQNGLITAVAAGKTRISASAGEHSAYIEVEVKDITVTFTPEELVVGTGEMSYVTVSITPEEYKDEKITWSVDDETIAKFMTLDDYPDNVYITGVAIGTTVLRGSVLGIEAECKITVKEIEVTDIVVRTGSGQVIQGLTLKTHGNAAEINAYVKPENATSQTIELEVADPSIAVAEGFTNQYGQQCCTITPEKPGNTTLLIKAKGYTKEFPLSVADAEGGNPYVIGDLLDRYGDKGIVWDISDDRSEVRILSMKNGPDALWSSEDCDAGVPDDGSHDDGLDNTEKLLSISGTDFPAAQWCRSLGEGWYLPSAKELQKIFVAERLDVEYGRTENGGDAYPAEAWSSNEADTYDALRMHEKSAGFWKCEGYPKTLARPVMAAKRIVLVK